MLSQNKGLGITKQKTNKFRATPTEVDGIRFPSILESKRYLELKQQQEQGKITELKLHPKVTLLPTIPWELDASYLENGVLIYEDTKGAETRDFKVKKKLWALFGEHPLRIVKKYPGIKTWAVEEMPPGKYRITARTLDQF